MKKPRQIALRELKADAYKRLKDDTQLPDLILSPNTPLSRVYQNVVSNNPSQMFTQITHILMLDLINNCSLYRETS